MAPILTMPDPQQQFVVEVDASNERIGAVLSQRSAWDGKMQPCAFLCQQLSKAEHNFDVGNQELLAVGNTHSSSDHKKAKPKDSDVAQILDLEFEAWQTFIDSDATKEEDRAAKIMSIHVLKILVM